MKTELETVRKQFESWISGDFYGRPIGRYVNDPEKVAWPGSYRDINTDLAWQAWKTAWELGDKCRDGCKIKRAVKEYTDHLSENREEPKYLGQ